MARKPSTAKTKETPVTDTAANAAPAPATVAPAPAATPAPIVAPVETAAVEWGANSETSAVADFGLLGKIVEATNANSFVYLGTDETASLVAAGFAEINPGMVDDGGGVATRATQQGISKMTEQNASVAATADATAPAATNTAGDPATVPAVTGNKIFNAADFADIFATPVKRSNSGRQAKHDFDVLEVGQFFVVPATDKMPDPKKSLASTISSAERRFATEEKNADGSPKTRTMKIKGVERTVPVYTKTREFESRSLDDGKAFGEQYAGKKVAVVRRTS